MTQKRNIQQNQGNQSQYKHPTIDTRKFFEEEFKQQKNLAKIFNENMEELIKCAEEIARKEKKNIKSAQLRKYFSRIKGIKLILRKEKIDLNEELPPKVKMELIRLKPLLAYAASGSRERQLISREFYELMIVLIDNIKTFADFIAFESFFEAIVAFHKYYEGVKDGKH